MFTFHISLRQKKIWFLPFLLTLLLPSNLFAANPVILEPDKEEYPLAAYLDILEDKEGKLTIEDMVSPQVSSRFITNKKDSLSFGFTDSAYWVRFTIKHPAEGVKKEWLLEIALPTIDHIELYIPDPSGDFKIKRTGRSAPFSEREIGHRNFIFPLTPPSGLAQTHYLRIKSEDGIFLPITLRSKDYFYKKSYKEYIFLGVYYGAIFIMVLYNLFVFISLRDRNYLFYILYVTSHGLFQLVLNGVAYEYLWQNHPWWNKHAEVFLGSVAMFWAAVFARGFLSARQHTPKLDKGLLIGMGLSAILSAMSLTMNYSLTAKMINLLVLYQVVITISAAILCWKKGYKPARYFTIAWSSFLLGILLIVLANFNILPFNFITLYGMQIGSVFDVTLLSLALADRINIMKEERENLHNTISAEKEYFSSLIENTSDILTLINADGTISQNTPRREVFGYGSEELIGRNVFELIHPEDVSNVLEAFQQVIQKPGSIQVREFRFKRKDGSYCVLESIGTNLIANPVVKAVFVTSRDITERKEKEEAEKESRAKSEFLAKMSHEIRTPMNAIIGMTELISDTPLNLEQREYIETAKNSAHSLLRLLDDILDISKIEAGKLEIEDIPFNLYILTEITVKSFSLRAEKKGLKLKYHIHDDVPPALNGDPLRLRQVLVNLIGNAIKFTEKGEVVVEIKKEDEKMRGWEDEKKLLTSQPLNFSTSQPPVLLVFSVKDTGIGIPDEKLENIFDSFTQADGSMARRYGGTGLGLAISKELVKLMGGRIWVESEAGKGSAFYFTAKLRQGEEKQIDPSPFSSGETGEVKGIKKILLVEDNPLNQKVAVSLLKKRGHAIAIANNGLEAIDKLAHEDFDIVLMDVQMPEMDGFETTKIIRDPSSPVRNHNITIIAMTAHAMKGYKEKCIEGGMNDYISKPLNKEELFGKIEGIKIEKKTSAVKKVFSEEIIDRKYLLNTFEEDRESIKKLFDAFMEDIPKTIEDMQKAINIGDTGLLRKKAHFIKGGAGNIGANILKETASGLEKAAENNDIEKAGKLYKKMEFELNRVMKEIRNF